MSHTVRVTIATKSVLGLLAISALGPVPDTAQAGNEIIIGIGQIHTVTGKKEILEGPFAGVAIGVDGPFVDLKNATVDCGGAPGSVGVDLGSHSKVRIHKGNVRNCVIGVLSGNKFGFGPGGEDNHISGMVVEDASSAGGTGFNGAGIVIDSGFNNHVQNNTVRGATSQSIWVLSGENNKVIHNFIGVMIPQGGFVSAGVHLQQAVTTTVESNQIATETAVGILVNADGADFNVITDNYAVQNTDPNVIDLNPGCAHNIWENNQFVTDGGAETNGPGVGCIQ